MKLKKYIIGLLLALASFTASFATDYTSDRFTVYPNPVVDDVVTIDAEYDIYKIEILSIVGQIVHSEELEPSNSVRLSINLQPGVYLIKVSFTNKTSDIKRIWVN